MRVTFANGSGRRYCQVTLIRKRRSEMKLRAFLITVAISAATIFSLHDALAEQASRVLTTHATYTANSTQAKAIQQWLRDHPGFQEGRRLGEIGRAQV